MVLPILLAVLAVSRADDGILFQCQTNGARVVYLAGDFNEWALESESEGSAVIKVSRSWIDDAGEIQTAQERYIVAVPAWSATTTTIAKAQ